MGDGGEVCETIVDNQVSLAPHSAAYEGRRYTVHIFDLVAEAVARGLMPGSVFPEGLEINVTEVVFHRYGILLNNVRNLRLRVGGLGELEPGTVYVVPEGHDVDALPVLRDSVVLAVENLVQRGVTHVLQGVDDDLERVAFVVDGQSLDVLAENDLRSVEIADSDNIEEQCSAGHAFVIVVESLFSAGDGECLARKSCETDVKVGNVLLVDFGYISVDLFGGVEIGFVGLLGIRVPFAGEDRLDLVSEGFVEPHTDPADSCEEIDGFVDLVFSHSSTPDHHMSGLFMKLPVLPGPYGILNYVCAFLKVLLNLFPPETENNPALFLEHSVDLLIAFHVPLYFGNPEFPAGFDIVLAMFPIISVPELAVTEHCDFLSNESYVWFSWNIFDIFTIM